MIKLYSNKDTSFSNRSYSLPPSPAYSYHGSNNNCKIFNYFNNAKKNKLD